MTFLEYLKVKKGIGAEERELNELMDEYYEEYVEYLNGVKDGCAPEE